MRGNRTAIVLMAASLAGCGSTDALAPMGATPVRSSVTIGLAAPASGTAIVVDGEPPGAFIPRGSGQLTVPLTFTSGREVPFAQIYVFLLTADGYCGQNLPDAPTFAPFRAGQTVTYSVTGFQVFRLPCEVTGLRAVLHTRNNGNLGPPLPDETLAEATLSVGYHLRGR